MKVHRPFAALAVICLAAAAAIAGDGEPARAKPKDAPQPPPFRPERATIPYPASPDSEHVDEYHGVKVPDPDRWLEGDATKDHMVADWVLGQNKITNTILRAIPERETIRARLTKLWDYERYSAPFKVGSRYMFSKNSGLQQQSVLYVQDSLDAEPRELLNPNNFSSDGTVALAGLSLTQDGSLMAYGVASGGSDWVQWHVRDVATGKDLPDLIKWTKFTSPAWLLDNSGFFYGRYAEPKEGESKLQSINKFQKLYFHKLGTEQSADTLVYERADQPDWAFGAQVSEDGQYVVLGVSKGTDDKNMLLYYDLKAANGKVPTQADFVSLVDSWEAEYSFLGNDGPVFYFNNDLDTPKGRVIAIDTKNPASENWKVIIPQSENVLLGAGIVNNQFVATYLKDAATHVRIFDMTGKHVRDVEFPALGSAGGFGGLRTDTETFYSFTSFTYPPSTWRYDMTTGKSTLLKQAQVDFNPADYETKQVFYSSKDGTRVPMFITHKKGLVLDGSNPTLLYAYGGFNIPITPSFSVANLAWMEMGGIYASANIRGGGEYGEEWHKAGTKLKKQNVFDDFIAAAEYLITERYTSPEKLSIMGGSNGGLLVGAVMTQRPDLFAVAIPIVGVLDMLRFHQFTIGWAWKDDYGSSENPEEFKALLAYSPLHNLVKGVKYPATMIITGDHDDRVVPAHSFKFANRLQNTHEGTAPVVIRVDVRAGHGAGKPTDKQIAEATDRLAFMMKYTNMKPTLPQVAPAVPDGNK
ncbi:MAG: prolyl oligopeptidase family serine peptidase [Phycisphaerales bacterium]